MLDVHMPNLGALALEKELSKVYEDGEEQEETPLQVHKLGYPGPIFDNLQGGVHQHPSAFTVIGYLTTSEDA